MDTWEHSAHLDRCAHVLKHVRVLRARGALSVRLTYPANNCIYFKEHRFQGVRWVLSDLKAGPPGIRKNLGFTVLGNDAVPERFRSVHGAAKVFALAIDDGSWFLIGAESVSQHL